MWSAEVGVVETPILLWRQYFLTCGELDSIKIQYIKTRILKHNLKVLKISTTLITMKIFAVSTYTKNSKQGSMCNF